MNPKEPKRKLYYYYIAAILVIFFLNAYVFPSVFKPQVKEIPYGTFLEMVTEGKFSKVEITDKKIAALATNTDDKQIYVTGRVEDPQLVDRLVKSKVTFSQVIPRESSPLENFFMTWVLPILFFFVVGQLIMRYMGNHMGGNAMSFGKSNAKVYVEAQTGKSFADVAGQEHQRREDGDQHDGRRHDGEEHLPRAALSC